MKIDDVATWRDVILLGTAAAMTAPRKFRGFANRTWHEGRGVDVLLGQLDELVGVIGLLFITAYFRDRRRRHVDAARHRVGVRVARPRRRDRRAHLRDDPRAGTRTPSSSRSCSAASRSRRGSPAISQLSPIAICFIAGVLVTNFPNEQRDSVFRILNHLERPVHLLFLIIAGALWDVDRLARLGARAAVRRRPRDRQVDRRDRVEDRRRRVAAERRSTALAGHADVGALDRARDQRREPLSRRRHPVDRHRRDRRLDLTELLVSRSTTPSGAAHGAHATPPAGVPIPSIGPIDELEAERDADGSTSSTTATPSARRPDLSRRATAARDVLVIPLILLLARRRPHASRAQLHRRVVDRAAPSSRSVTCCSPRTSRRRSSIGSGCRSSPAT